MKTVVAHDCIPSFSNILVATIIDIDENRVVKSFGIKKGTEFENIENLILSHLFSPIISRRLSQILHQAIYMPLFVINVAFFIFNDEKIRKLHWETIEN